VEPVEREGWVKVKKKNHRSIRHIRKLSHIFCSFVRNASADEIFQFFYFAGFIKNISHIFLKKKGVFRS